MANRSEKYPARPEFRGRVGVVVAVLLTLVSVLLAPAAVADPATDPGSVTTDGADSVTTDGADSVTADGADSATADAAGSAATGGIQSVFAIGDSFASGQGSPDSGKTFEDSQTCSRSYRSWPYLLATGTPGLSWADSAACSAAKSNAVYEKFRGQDPQALTLYYDISSTELVTVMIGGNDIGFADVVGECYVSDCTNGATKAASQRIEQVLPQTLPTAYYYIRLAAPNARIVVVGYPSLLPANGSLSTTLRCLWLSNSERKQLNDLAEQLDGAIRTQAEAAGFEYVSTLDAMDGHEMCTSDPHVYPVGPASLIGWRAAYQGHPTPAGQVDLEKTVRTGLKRLGII